MTPDIDPAEVIELARKLVRIESISGNERAIAEFIAGFLAASGIGARIVEAAPGRPNVYARIGSGRSSLMLNGHTDTVPIGNGWTRDALGSEVADGRLYGRGACDMKSGLAAIMAALVACQRQIEKPSGAVEFSAVVDEEVAGLGIKSAIAHGIEARLAVIAEPTELQTICAAKGNCYFTIDVRGRAAHAGSPRLGVNAIAAAAEIVKAVERHDAMLSERQHPLLGTPHATVTVIAGGTGESSVPDCCRITIDRRLLPGETGASALAELKAHLSEIHHPAGFDVSLDMELPAMAVATEHPFVGEVRRTGIACGAPDHPVGGWSAACDGGHLHGAGIATVLFGPGSITRQAHRPDESVPLDEIVVAARTYAVLAARALQV